MFDVHSHKLLQLIIISLLLESGCKSVKNIPVAHLAYILQKFILRMGEEIKKIVELENCYEPNVHHVSKAFLNFNINWMELHSFMDDVPGKSIDKRTSIHHFTNGEEFYEADEGNIVRPTPTFNESPLEEHSVSSRIRKSYDATGKEDTSNTHLKSTPVTVCLSPTSETPTIRNIGAPKPKVQTHTHPMFSQISNEQNNETSNSANRNQENEAIKIMPAGTFHESLYKEDPDCEDMKRNFKCKREFADTSFKLTHTKKMKRENSEVILAECTKQVLPMVDETSCWNESQIKKTQALYSQQISKNNDDSPQPTDRFDESVHTKEDENYGISINKQNSDEQSNLTEIYEKDESSEMESKRSDIIIQEVICIDDKDNIYNDFKNSSENNENISYHPGGSKKHQNSNIKSRMSVSDIADEARKSQIVPSITKNDFFEEFYEDIPRDDSFHESSDDDTLYSDKRIEEIDDCVYIHEEDHREHNPEAVNGISPKNGQRKMDNGSQINDAISSCTHSETSTLTTILNEDEVIEILSDSDDFEDKGNNETHMGEQTNINQTSSINIKFRENKQSKDINPATQIENDESEKSYMPSCDQDIIQSNCNRKLMSRKCKIRAREKTKKQLEEELKETQIDLRDAINYQSEFNGDDQNPRDPDQRLRASEKLLEEFEMQQTREMKYLDENGCFVWICPACKCLQDDNPMVCCDSCNNWFHYSCIGFNNYPTNEEWFCPKCSPVARKTKLTH